MLHTWRPELHPSKQKIHQKARPIIPLQRKAETGSSLELMDQSLGLLGVFQDSDRLYLKK